MVFPKPARACEGATRRGETRVKGSRAIHSPGGLVEEEVRVVPDEDEVEGGEWEEEEERPSPSPGLKVRAANRELLKFANAGSNVHNSHLSKVTLVSPCDELELGETTVHVVSALDLP